MTGKPSAYETDLDRVSANFEALTPLTFLRRCAVAYPEKTAIIHGDRRISYGDFYARARRLASALEQRGVGRGDTVSVMATNIPALLEAHYGVPMLGAVLNPLNTRLDAATIAFILEHGEAKVLLVDKVFAETVKAALSQTKARPFVIDIDDVLAEGGSFLGEIEYEDFLSAGDPGYEWPYPPNEWDALALNYTSGTTGDPKGVVFSHRGAYLNAIGSVLSFNFRPDAIYLWTLPMFHCNGWTNTWALSVVGATHVCLRQVDPELIFALIDEHKVTHMSGAPIVLNMLIHAPDSVKRGFTHGPVDIATGGAAPPSAVIAGMETMGFRVKHLYGLTESYGPSTECVWQDEWDALPEEEQLAKVARQGVNIVTLQEQRVINPDTMQDVPADGETVGEIVLRGNTVMKGYLKNPKASAAAFEGGWFHTGDLAVLHPDGYAEIKDRAKDIIISGGENISSLEVEEVLYRHPDIMEAAVVAKPDEKWGETPCAFVTLTPEAGGLTAQDVIDYCRDNMAHYKCPSVIVFGPLPKTSTGKIQKFVLRDQAMEL
ncbi:MAG: acyl-CoA synthetase [Alphaproteobacteria bacterium]|nr:acyl-CoA synthetase [Alphaproteobacteria bacterium]